METTIPAVKSLLVRARITLAESSESRALSCDEVRVELAEAAEGLRKVGGPVRIHVRDCEGCTGFRSQLRSDRKALAAVFPFGPLAMLKAGALGKLFGGGAATSSTSTAVGALGGSAAGGTAAFGSLSAIGGAIGSKAVVTAAATALLTAGAVEVSKDRRSDPAPAPAIEQAEMPSTPAAAGPAANDFEHRMVNATAELTARPSPAAKADRREDPAAGAPLERGEEPAPSVAPPATEPDPAAAPEEPIVAEPSEPGTAVITDPAAGEGSGRPEPDSGDGTVTTPVPAEEEPAPQPPAEEEPQTESPPPAVDEPDTLPGPTTLPARDTPAG